MDLSAADPAPQPRATPRTWHSPLAPRTTWPSSSSVCRSQLPRPSMSPVRDGRVLPHLPRCTGGSRRRSAEAGAGALGAAARAEPRQTREGASLGRRRCYIGGRPRRAGDLAHSDRDRCSGGSGRVRVGATGSRGRSAAREIVAMAARSASGRMANDARARHPPSLPTPSGNRPSIAPGVSCRQQRRPERGKAGRRER